jgi:acyl-CoA thioester hydrolase
MPEPFARDFHVRWSDTDFNAHMRNTAYLDIAADLRMTFFETRGFSMREFERLRIGPVVVRDEIEYHREMRMLEPFRATLLLAGLSPDGGRFRLENAFYRRDGRLSARVTSSGGWLDLAARRLVPPPAALLAALEALVRSPAFESLPVGRGARD